jgi:hypothetical protein
MTEMTPTMHGALVTAAQTGQVMVGPYASQEIITQLVGAGFGSYITEPGEGSALRVIGFEINEKGRNAARTGAPATTAEAPREPWPLAEGDKVRLTLDAEVFARPDPEDEPGEDYWTFAVQVCGERVLLDGMLPAEVAERVRKAPTKSTGMRACA